MSYLNELAEIRRLLDRSACRHWWEVASLELFGQQPLLVDGAVGRSAPHVPHSVVLALEFSRRPLGELRLQLSPHLFMGPAHESALTELAAQCAGTVQRLASQRWVVQAQWGAPCLIGSSPAMLALDRHIEESCVDARPVALLGTSCNEALQTAAAIHHGGAGAGRTFVKVDCATTLEPPWRWVDRARGGTLFLCNADHGTHADQEHLWLQLEQAMGLSTQLGSHWACRLVVALKAPHLPDPSSSPIPHGAWSQCDWKVITLPPLAQHPEDIPVLVRAVLDYHGHSAEHRMTDALRHWCTNYAWPGNAAQLEWTVARMALLTANTPIGASDISLLSPRLLGDAGPAYTLAEPQAPRYENRETAPPQANLPTVAQPVEHWVRCVLEHDTPAFAQLHAGLARALQYLCKQFHEPISTEQLADQAHVSVSHLRFLFRDSLGLPFKLFLQHVRIAHAQRLLLASPQRRITDVALSVGFSDFSHFQKCFRQIVGQTPGDLRRARALARG
ncbi:helix-turn-helix domain-containing protein [Hydrogenophaga sp. A37]